jgi:hypothetical protein
VTTKTIRAGGLDDPIWSSSDAVGEQTLKDRRPRTFLVVIVIVGALIVASPFVLLAARHHHSGGDPGGGILQSIKESLGSALPADTHVTTSHFAEPQWTGGCGWSEVSGSETVSTTASEGVLKAHISDYLVAQGWSQLLETGVASSAWIQGTGSDAKRIELVAADRLDEGKYLLTASASPLGQVCGGG